MEAAEEDDADVPVVVAVRVAPAVPLPGQMQGPGIAVQGTGKTHTMVGPDSGPALGEEQFGLVPRLVRSLFRVLEQVQDTKTVVEVSFVEIFNEEVRDLLSDNLSGVCIDYDQHGKPRLAGLNQVECSTIPEVLACLDTGQSLHATAGLTILNSAQPASHTLFEIALTQATIANDGTEIHRHSTIQFCELAASDCLTGPSSALQLPGSQSDVNLGLLTLNNVVSALGDPRRKVSHVPYQDSLLTRLLAPALGGTTLTLLLCTVSSLARDQEETLSTLLFACRAANIKNNPQPGIVKREAVVGANNANRPVFLQLSPQQQQLSPQQMQLSPQQPSPKHMMFSPQQMPLSPQQMPLSPQQMQLSPEQGQQNLEQFYTSRRDSDLSSIGVFNGHLIGEQNLAQGQIYGPAHNQQPFQAFPSPGGPMQTGPEYPRSFPNPFPIQSPNPPSYFEQSQNQHGRYNPHNPNQFPPQGQSNPQTPNNLISTTPQMYASHLQNNSHHHLNPNLQMPPTYTAGPLSPPNFPTSPPQPPAGGYPYFHGGPQPPPQPPPYPGFPTSPYQQGRPYLAHSTPLGPQHLTSPPPLTSRTTPTSSSPLSHRGNAGVHLYLPNHHHHQHTQSLSSVSLPNDTMPLLGNQGHLLIGRTAGDHPNLIKLEKNEEQTSREEEIFALQFAASQYKALLSNAENLLQNISASGEEKEKKEIASWLCSKEESEEAILASGGDGKEKKSLSQILEEEEEDGGSTARTASSRTNSSDETGTEVGESIEDFDSECSDVSAEDVEARLEVIEAKFRAETESLVNDAEVHFWTLGNELKRWHLDEAGNPANFESTTNEQRLTEVAAQQLVALSSQLGQHKADDKGAQSPEVRRRLSGIRSEVLQLQRNVACAEGLLQGDAAGKMVHDQLEQLQEQHQLLAGQLQEERERKRGLETVLKREQVRIEELERRLREHETCARETLGVSRELELRAERVKREETRLEELTASLREQEQRLKRERQAETVNMARGENAAQTEDLGDKETSFIQSGSRGLSQNSKKDVFEMIPLAGNMAGVRSEVEDLRRVRDLLVGERQKLDDKLHEQKSLSSSEERRMIELDESVEAVDGAIEYKNDIICGKQVVYDASYKGEDALMKHLVRLGVAETRAMLHRYFVRVLDLRMEGRRMEVHLEEVEEQYTDLSKYVRNLAHSVQRAKLDGERKLLAQQREHQVKVNQLVQQLQEQGESKEQRSTTKALEREVAHYKRLVKELRRGNDNPEIAVVGGREVEESLSRPVSVVSHIQPSHIEQFQRRLAKLQRKMGEGGRPIVTREHRKLIIENAGSAQGSANSSVERSRERLEKHERERQERPGRRKK